MTEAERSICWERIKAFADEHDLWPDLEEVNLWSVTMPELKLTEDGFKRFTTGRQFRQETAGALRRAELVVNDIKVWTFRHLKLETKLPEWEEIAIPATEITA